MQISLSAEAARSQEFHVPPDALHLNEAPCAGAGGAKGGISGGDALGIFWLGPPQKQGVTSGMRVLSWWPGVMMLGLVVPYSIREIYMCARDIYTPTTYISHI